MMKFISFILVVAFAAAGLADSEVPLPGPGAPPTEPAPPQPTPPPPPQPTPYPTATPWPEPTPYPTPRQPGDPRNPGNPGQDVSYTLGVGQVGRFKSKTFTFRPPYAMRNLRYMQLVCTNSKIKIKSVQVHFRDGRIQDMIELTGTLALGDWRTAYLYSYPVRKVVITAGSSSVLRSDGAFRLDVAATGVRNPHEVDPEDPEGQNRVGELDGNENYGENFIENDGGAF